MLSKEYDVDRRNPWELEPYYSRHVIAMTREELHGKSDIACELAFRDKRIADTEAELLSLREQLAELKALPPLGYIDPRTLADEGCSGGTWMKRQPREVGHYTMPIFTAAKPAEE